jgi:toxin ParE1/3/4
MRRKLVYHADAIAGLNEAERYTVRTWGKAQAKRYIATLVADIKALRTNAERHRKHDDIYPGLRRKRSEMHHIYYLISGDSVVILAVIHVQCDPAAHLKMEKWGELGEKK